MQIVMHDVFKIDSMNHSISQFFQTLWFIQKCHYCVLSGDTMADSDFVCNLGGRNIDKFTGVMVTNYKLLNLNFLFIELLLKAILKG